MQPDVLIKDNLMKEAFRYSRNISTEEELIELALKEYVINHRHKNLKELKGKILFQDYDYKLMRKM